MVRISVIGCGNMGRALVRGLVGAGHTDLTVCDVDPEALESVASLGVRTSTDPSVAADAEVVFLVLKPDLVGTVLGELDLSSNHTVVSIAAGVPTGHLKEHTEASIVRLMPNLAAEWGLMAGAVTGDDVDPSILELLSDIGMVVEVDESLMNTATAVNGSGPAFVFYLIQALMQAGIENGLAEEDARVLAAQTFKGAAETILRSDQSIEHLIEAVCSPKGTTIEGMAVLRDSEIEETMHAAVRAAERRAGELALEVSDE